MPMPGVAVAKLANFTIKMPFLVFDIRNIAVGQYYMILS